MSVICSTYSKEPVVFVRLRSETNITLAIHSIAFHSFHFTQCKRLSNDMQYAFATALPDQLEDYGTDIKEHHRRLRTR